MPEHTPTITDNDIAEGFEIVESYTSSGFTKYRLKASGATMDVALIELPEEEVEDYIAGRQDELQHMSVDVPKPYKAEIETHGQEEPVDFTQEDGRVYGRGKADPEYNLLLKGMDQITRYDYLVTWRYFPEENVLTEIEVYLPTGSSREDAKTLADALILQSST